MTDEQKVIVEWLKKHDLIKHAALEKKCGMPQGCLYKAINGKIELPLHHVPALLYELGRYGLKIK